MINYEHEIDLWGGLRLIAFGNQTSTFRVRVSLVLVPNVDHFAYVAASPKKKQEDFTAYTL